jgi:probable F420-dependent oxidoreductase
MRIGAAIFITDRTVGPVELGRIVEERGLASLFVTEHTHMPVDHTPHPSGKPLAEGYKRSLDPFVALSAVAATTTTLRVGFGVCLVDQRDPIVTAKAVASLDLVSGGRVDFGVGAGWNRPELEHHGRPFENRFRVMRESVEAMRALWTQEEASYDGRFVRFSPSWSWPKPVQDPLPVYIGGNTDRALDRVLRYGDHWMPMVEQDLAERIASLRARAEEAGRPRPLVKFFGCSERDPAMAERLAAAGVDEALVLLPSRSEAAEIEAAADDAAALATQFV